MRRFCCCCSSTSCAGCVDVAFLVFDVVCSTSSAVFGALFMYSAGQNDCKLGAPLFLVISGAGNAVLSLVRYARPEVGSLLQLHYNIGMIVYGSVLAFGYTEDDDSPYFCNAVPFAMAVNTLVLFILYYISGVTFYFCCCVWVYLRVGQGDSAHVWAYRYSAGYIYSSLHYCAEHCTGRRWDAAQRTTETTTQRLTTDARAIVIPPVTVAPSRRLSNLSIRPESSSFSKTQKSYSPNASLPNVALSAKVDTTTVATMNNTV